MANRIKKNDGDMTRQELEEWAVKEGVQGFSHSRFKDNLINFCEDYGINLAWFYKNPEYDDTTDVNKCTGGNGFLIKREWKELFLTLLKTYDKNPFIVSAYDVKTGKVNYKNVNKYYEEALRMIEAMPENEEKYSVTYSSVYFRTQLENHVIEMVKGKMQQLAAATTCIGFQSKIQLWSKLYEVLDELIHYAYECELAANEEYLEKVENTKGKWKPAVQAEYQRSIYDICKNGKVNEEAHKKAIEKMVNSYSSVALDIELKLIEKDYIYGQGKNISEFLVEKLKERMIRFPVNPEHLIDDPSTTMEMIAEEERIKEVAKDVCENGKAIKELMNRHIKGCNIAKKGFCKDVILKEVEDVDQILKEKKKLLIEEREKELEENIKNLDSIETMEMWAKKTLDTGVHEGEPLTEGDKEHIFGYLKFLNKVKSRKDKFSTETNQLIEEPLMQQYF